MYAIRDILKIVANQRDVIDYSVSYAKYLTSLSLSLRRLPKLLCSKRNVELNVNAQRKGNIYFFISARRGELSIFYVNSLRILAVIKRMLATGSFKCFIKIGKIFSADVSGATLKAKTFFLLFVKW